MESICIQIFQLTEEATQQLALKNWLKYAYYKSQTRLLKIIWIYKPCLSSNFGFII